MGGCCCKQTEQEAGKNLFAPEEISKERLHISRGDTQIDVKQQNLWESEAQYIVTSIDNRGVGAGNEVIKHYKEARKYLSERKDEHHQYGSIIDIALDKQDKHLLCLVLPIYRDGSHDEELHLNLGVFNLIQYIQSNNVKSVAVEDIAVKRFGYPRQIIIRSLVTEFDKYLKENPQSGPEHMWFISSDMVTVSLFEQEIRRQVNDKKQLSKQMLTILDTQSNLKKSSFSMERGQQSVNRTSSVTRTQKDDLQQPLLAQ